MKQSKKNEKSYAKKNTSLASSYWLDYDFNSPYRTKTATGKIATDYIKLASTQRAIANFVSIVTGKNIPVQFNTRNDSSYTDGKSVVISSDLKNFDATVGLALHEGSHIHLTDFTVLHRLSNSENEITRRFGIDNVSYGQRIYIKNLINWIEDRRIDYFIYSTAPGYRMYYEAMYDKYFNNKVISRGLRSKQRRDETYENYLFHIINFTNPDRKLRALKGLQSVWNLIDLPHINRLATTHDVLNLAMDVYEIIQKYVEEAEKNDSTATSIKAPDSNDTESDDSEFDVDLTQKEQQQLQDAINLQKKFINNEIKKNGLTRKDQTKIDAIRESGTDVLKSNIGTDAIPIYIDNIIVKRLNESIMSVDALHIFESYYFNKRTADHSTDSSYINSMRRCIEEGVVMGKRLGTKLQLRNEDRTLKHTRIESGKIDRRLVAELGYGNESVFHKIVTEKYKRYLIHISIDASGSMDFDKFSKSIQSAVTIAQAASMTTGIRVQISFRGTSGDDTSTIVYAYDSNTDKMSKIRNLFPYLKTFGTTPEGIAFNVMYGKMKQDAGPDECIFINYSDGMPSNVKGTTNSSRRYNGIDYTATVVKKMRDAGIHIISMFIHSGYTNQAIQDEFKRMYGTDSKFVEPTNVIQIASVMNEKFLETNQ